MIMWKSLGQVWNGSHGGPALDCYYQLDHFRDELAADDEQALRDVAYEVLDAAAESGRGFNLNQLFETQDMASGRIVVLLFQPSGLPVVVDHVGTELPINIVASRCPTGIN